jgi:hypothetical protein
MKTRVSALLILTASAILLLILPAGAQRPQLPASTTSTRMTSGALNTEGVSRLDVPAYGVAVQGNYAYVAVRDIVAEINGLRIMDVSDPTAPTEIGFYPTPGFAENVAIAGSFAYVADGPGGLHIINVYNPAAPTKVGFYTTGGLYARNVAVVGKYAYVADFSGPLYVVNVSNPATPIKVGSYSAPDNLYDVAGAGGYAYAAARESGLRIVDVSNPMAPAETGFYDTPGFARSVAVEGDYAYIADDEAGLRVIDVATPTIPTETGFYDTPGHATGVAVARNYAYVADGGSGLRIINISDPITPTEEVWHDTGGDAEDVALAEGYVYVADGVGGLAIFKFAPPTSASIDPVTGGELSSPYDDTTYHFPPGIFTDTVIITHTPRFASEVPPFGDLININHIFEVTAVYSSTGQPAQLAPGYVYTLTVQYAPYELGVADENTLAFYYWDGNSSQWVQESTSLDMVARTVTATPDHLSIWAVLGEAHRVFLPILFKNP